jgi:hypothetical protein
VSSADPDILELQLWLSKKGCGGKEEGECITGYWHDGQEGDIILFSDMPTMWSTQVRYFNYCPVCGRSLKPNATLTLRGGPEKPHA